MEIPDYAVWALLFSVIFTIIMWTKYFPWKIIGIFRDLSTLWTKEDLENMSPKQRQRILDQTAIMTNIGLKMFIHLFQDKEFKKNILKPALKEMAVMIAKEYGMTRTVIKNGEEIEVLSAGKGVGGKMGNLFKMIKEGKNMLQELQEP